MVFQQPWGGPAWIRGYPMGLSSGAKAPAGPLPEDTPAGESAALPGVCTQREAPGQSGGSCLHARCLLLRVLTQDGQ